MQNETSIIIDVGNKYYVYIVPTELDLEQHPKARPTLLADHEKRAEFDEYEDAVKWANEQETEYGPYPLLSQWGH